MFWIGLIVGIVITVILVAAWFYFCFKVTYHDVDTFVDMCTVVHEACENREAIVTVTHNDEVLATAVFEELE